LDAEFGLFFNKKKLIGTVKHSLLTNILYYAVLISISLYSSFLINKNLYLATSCLMFPYFNVQLDDHIRQAWR